MKYIIYILTIILISSCLNITKSDIKNVKSSVIYKKFISKHEETGYHYGYSMMNGKYCMHYGTYDVEDSYTIYYIVEQDTFISNDVSLYDKDSLNISYVNVYIDSVYAHKEIIKID